MNTKQTNDACMLRSGALPKVDNLITNLDFAARVFAYLAGVGGTLHVDKDARPAMPTSLDLSGDAK